MRVNGGVLPEYTTAVWPWYKEAIVQKEIVDWLEREGWNYEIGYSSQYVDGSDSEEEQYATALFVDIIVEDIESGREKVADQLSVVLENLIASYADKGVTIKNGKDYRILIGLYLESEPRYNQESMWLIGRKGEIDISKEGLIEEFKKDKNLK